MQRVFVVDTTKKPLGPCSPARARRLLCKGKAAVYRREPFTIILKHEVTTFVPPVELRIDPGSKTTGIAVVGKCRRGDRVLWAGELEHRGQAIRDALTARRSIRRGRRNRHTRYRAPRFDNRTRPDGWLPPSLMSRVNNVTAWAKKIVGFAPVGTIAVETVRFDTQALQNPEITGVEYQQGTLSGYEVKEYLLEKWSRKCAYCGKGNVPLEVDHVVPRKPKSGRHGSDRVSNLVMACHTCNDAKDNRSVEEFLAGRPEVLRKVLAQLKAPLKDAAAVNATRFAIGRALKDLGLPVSFWTGGRTKFNRASQGYPKAHWIDAACVGNAGGKVFLNADMRVQHAKALGRGTRQVVKADKYGFPRTAAGRIKRVRGFQTGDIVVLKQPTGKYAGLHLGRLAGVRITGMLDIKTIAGVKITSRHDRFQIVQKGDGYAYAH